MQKKREVSVKNLSPSILDILAAVIAGGEDFSPSDL